MITQKNNTLFLRNQTEILKVEPWGENSLRVRSTKYPDFAGNNNALLEKKRQIDVDSISLNISGDHGSITNGKITAIVDKYCNLSFYNQYGKELLTEFQRITLDGEDSTVGVNIEKTKHFNSALKVNGREFKPIIGGDYQLSVRFEADDSEKIYGMGQYQKSYLDLKNSKIELAHRNSQASVPFMLSNKGYGFLWNNPANGVVTFAKNETEWIANSTKEMDYWITAGDSPSQIEQAYAGATGKAPMMPSYALGYWQCKLRYQTQEEVMEAANGFKERGIPVSVIIIDFFHWTVAGDFQFDPKYWPNPQKMTDELHKLGIKVMVSVWPTIDKNSKNYSFFKDNGFLVQTERGYPINMHFNGNFEFADFTNPKVQKVVWNILKKNYLDLGIDLFWLDEAEPQFTVYDYDNYRFFKGSALQVGNEYPVQFSQMVFDGMKAEGDDMPIHLVRSAWAGSQKTGAVVWSGDIDSSFKSLKNQLAVGLSMGIAGIPWWTSDIGGFHGGYIENPSFQELVARWTQFAAFCPVMRMHGDREPHTAPLSDHGGGINPSGASTEPWAYGERTYKVMKKYIKLRYNMKEYIKQQMLDAHRFGTPVMRPLFYDFPNDSRSWKVEDQYMFGSSLLVAPVLAEKENERNVYLPKGSDWIYAVSGQTILGGTETTVETPLDTIPVFVKKGDYLDLEKQLNLLHK